MWHNQFNHLKLILASGSPRRQQFLTDLGLKFEIQIKPINEIYPENLQKEEITNYLANLKADAFTNIAHNEVIITSDTIVWLENEALGKPENNENAIQMLQKLSGKTHQVYTSVCLKSKNKTVIFSSCTQVTFSKLTIETITYYLNHFKPFDKAGSYGIQDWIGLVGITKIEGSYTNVVGFPTEQFISELLKF